MKSQITKIQMRTCAYFEDLPENAQVYHQFWLKIFKKALSKKL